jgi:hypothetical protein
MNVTQSPEQIETSNPAKSRCNSTFLIYNVDIPFAKQTDPKYLQELRKLEEKLNDPREIEKACVHETGHLLYFARVGVTKTYIQVPRIFPKGEQFDYHMAAVGTERQQISATNARRLILVARAIAAGGVFLQELKGVQNGGDNDDYTNFVEYCELYQRTVSSKPFNKRKLWRKAQNHVKRELQRKDSLLLRAGDMANMLKRLFFFRIIV